MVIDWKPISTFAMSVSILLCHTLIYVITDNPLVLMNKLNQSKQVAGCQ